MEPYIKKYGKNESDECNEITRISLVTLLLLGIPSSVNCLTIKSIFCQTLQYLLNKYYNGFLPYIV